MKGFERDCYLADLSNNLRTIQEAEKPCYHLKTQVYEALIHPGTCKCAPPGEFWEKIRPLLPSKSTQQQHIQLLEDERLISDNMEIANIINKQFIDGVAAHIPTLYL